jgi:hypothetical protein
MSSALVLPPVAGHQTSALAAKPPAHVDPAGPGWHLRPSTGRSVRAWRPDMPTSPELLVLRYTPINAGQGCGRHGPTWPPAERIGWLVQMAGARICRWRCSEPALWARRSHATGRRGPAHDGLGPVSIGHGAVVGRWRGGGGLSGRGGRGCGGGHHDAADRRGGTGRDLRGEVAGRFARCAVSAQMGTIGVAVTTQVAGPAGSARCPVHRRAGIGQQGPRRGPDCPSRSCVIPTRL